MEKKPTLWTKNFTILSLGTVVSTLGNAVSGFAICLLVLDYTGSTLLYAIFNVVYNLPKVIMPFLAGPYLERFSRAKSNIYAGFHIGRAVSCHIRCAEA